MLIVDFGFARTLKDMQDADRRDVRALGAGRQPVPGMGDDDVAMDDACNARDYAEMPSGVREVILRLVHEKLV